MKKSILFVDDDPHVLTGLKRGLRPLRKAWVLDFAEGGEQALQRLEERRYDIVVSDMKMPQIDGSVLLATLYQRFPTTVRVILSGFTDPDLTQRIVPYAHRVLTKPCDVQELGRILVRIGHVLDLISDRVIRELVGGLKTLPPLPRIFSQLRVAIEQPDVTIHDITKIIEQDIAMSAKMLHLANSGFFRSGRRISTVEEAISYLGFQMVTRVALSIEVFDSLNPNMQVLNLDLDGLQRYALLTAHIASTRIADKQTSADAFMAGMLHDVGLLVLAMSAPDLLAEILEEARHSNRSLCGVEVGRLGVSHAEVGGYLLALWGLPYAIVEGVVFHHQPSRMCDGDARIVTAVHLATVAIGEIEEDTAYIESIGAMAELEQCRKQFASLGELLL